MIEVLFEEGKDVAAGVGLWQYDYGQYLVIKGLNLPMVCEVDFSFSEKSGDSRPVEALTIDGVTTCRIPNRYLWTDNEYDYRIYAFIYVVDDESGETVKKIKMKVKSRPRPSNMYEIPEDDLYFQKIIIEILRLSNIAKDSSDESADILGQIEELKTEFLTHMEELQALEERVNTKEEEIKEIASEVASNKTSVEGTKAQVETLKSQIDQTADEVSANATQVASHLAETKTAAETTKTVETRVAQMAEQALQQFDNKTAEGLTDMAEEVQKAKQYSDSARTSAETATTQAGKATTSASVATEARTVAETAKTDTQRFASEALQNRNQAETYAGRASASAGVAAENATMSINASVNAANRAAEAEGSANLARASATQASTSATEAKNALQELKDGIASGDFKGADGAKGEKGDPGRDGRDGVDGYTPVKGVDYFDGAKGEKGDPGEKGADGSDYVITEADYQAIADLIGSGSGTGNGSIEIVEELPETGEEKTLYILKGLDSDEPKVSYSAYIYDDGWQSLSSSTGGGVSEKELDRAIQKHLYDITEPTVLTNVQPGTTLKLKDRYTAEDLALTKTIATHDTGDVWIAAVTLSDGSEKDIMLMPGGVAIDDAQGFFGSIYVDEECLVDYMGFPPDADISSFVNKWGTPAMVNDTPALTPVSTPVVTIVEWSDQFSQDELDTLCSLLFDAGGKVTPKFASNATINGIENALVEAGVFAPLTDEDGNMIADDNGEQIYVGVKPSGSSSDDTKVAPIATGMFIYIDPQSM